MKYGHVLNRMAVGVCLVLGVSAASAQAEEKNANLARSAEEADASDKLMQAQQRVLGAVRGLLGQRADLLNPDEMEAQIADRVPGFAGWIYRDDGSLVARMALPAGTPPELAARALSSQMAMDIAPEVRAALYDSRQLLSFKQGAFKMATADGIIATHIDREANRVEVSYNETLRADQVEALARQLTAAGIPGAAIVLRPAELPLQRATVGVSVRAQPTPLAAGAQFNFTTTSGTFVCSVGVPATRAGVRGFVTASHCSQRVYSVTANTSMRAPNGTYVGNERVDPAGFSCSLPDTLGCRRADALFVSGAAASAVDFARVLVTNTNSLIVAGTIPVRGTLNTPAVGQTVYKTGRTTGTRSGRVARVCVDALVGDGAGNTYGALCSVEINSSTFSAGGDSGSSIWVYDGTGAVITGILSYGSSSTTGFSPWGGVVSELGALTVQ